jgi:hypothetical protein
VSEYLSYMSALLINVLYVNYTNLYIYV